MNTLLVIIDTKDGPLLKDSEKDSLSDFEGEVQYIEKCEAAPVVRRVEDARILPYFRRCDEDLAEVINSATSRGAVILNSVQRINFISDKVAVGRLIATTDIPVPRTEEVVTLSDVKRAIQAVGCPLVVKGFPGGGGGLVSLHHDETSICETIDRLVARGHRVLVQEYIPESAGRDIRVQVCAGRATHAILRKASTDNFRANIALGGSYEQIELTEDLVELSETVASQLQMNFVGLDFLFGEHHLFFNEANAAFAWHMYPEVGRHILDYLA